MKQLDRKFSAANRKITLIIDNCMAIPHVEQLNSIELISLPSNTKSYTQPMDQGIILTLKAKYCSLTIQKLIAALGKENLVPTISILSAVAMLEETWNDVSNKTSLIASRKLASLRKKWKKCLMTKMTPLLA